MCAYCVSGWTGDVWKITVVVSVACFGDLATSSELVWSVPEDGDGEVGELVPVMVWETVVGWFVESIVAVEAVDV